MLRVGVTSPISSPKQQTAHFNGRSASTMIFQYDVKAPRAVCFDCVPPSFSTFFSETAAFETGNKFSPAFASLTFPQEKKQHRLPEATTHRRASLSPDRLHPSSRLKKKNLRNCSQNGWRGGRLIFYLFPQTDHYRIGAINNLDLTKLRSRCAKDTAQMSFEINYKSFWSL